MLFTFPKVAKSVLKYIISYPSKKYAEEENLRSPPSKYASYIFQCENNVTRNLFFTI